MPSTMMFDHPSWLLADDGRVRRAFRTAGAVWSVVCVPQAEGAHHAVEVTRVAGEGDTPPVVDVVDPRTLVGRVEVCDPLRAGGPVGRVRNPDIWEALGTAVIRQVIRAAHARKLYRRFCEAHGERVDTAAGPALLFPTPDRVLALSDGEFADLGLRFFRVALRNAAEAFAKSGDRWATLSPADLFRAVQAPRRVGRWTAGATVADVTNDYSFYPFADRAVRTWAGKLAPSLSWPESEQEFGQVWQAMAGDQLSEWTLLTLAWGIRHATGVAV